eukprot:UN06989
MKANNNSLCSCILLIHNFCKLFEVQLVGMNIVSPEF